MKISTLLLFFILLSGFSNAQSYSLDPTFGNQGYAIKNVLFKPQEIILVDNKYYISSSTYNNAEIYRITYSGEPDATFANNGKLSLNSPGISRQIIGFIYADSFFYAYGQTNAGNNNLPKDGFVAKFDSSGNFDPTFGINGIATVDFGTFDIIDDFVFDPSGKLFCVGASKLFKLTATGAIDYSFDAAGYKTVEQSSSIKKYNGQYLLIGTKTESINSQYVWKLVIASIDDNGTPNTSFGENGRKYAPLSYSASLRKCQLIDDKLYVDYYTNWSFFSSGTALAKYDLLTDQLVYNIENFAVEEQCTKIRDGQAYYVTSGRCVQGACPHDFRVTRVLENGSLDTGFHNGNSTFAFTFPPMVAPALNTGSRPFALYLDDSSSIFMAGTTRSFTSPDGETRLAMLRLQPSALSVGESEVNNVNVYPNPFDDHVHISTKKPISAIEISDVTGRKIKNASFTNDGAEVTVDISGLSAKGIYIMSVSFADGAPVESVKILKR